MNPVSLADLAIYWRALTVPEMNRAQLLLDWAWADLSERAPGLADRLANGSLSLSLLKVPVLEAVTAIMRNPDGWDRESVDDWAGQRTNPQRFVWDQGFLDLLQPWRGRTSFSITPG